MKKIISALKKIIAGKINFRVKGRKLFVNMLLANLLIGTIPVVILGTNNYQTNLSIMTQDGTLNYSKTLEQTVNNSDQYMEQIYGLIRSLGENSSISQYKWGLKDRYTSDFYVFLNSIEQYIQNFNGINSIFLFMDQNVIATGKGIMAIENFADIDWSRKVISKAKENYKYLAPYVSEKNRKTSIGSEIGQDVVSIVSPIGNGNLDKGSIVLNISESYFRKNINNLKKYNQDSIYIVNTATGSIISKADGTNYYSDLSAAEITQYINEIDAHKNWRTIDVNGRKTVVAYAKSTSTPWTYIIFSDYRNITEQLDSVRNTTIFYLFILILIELLISLFLVARVYSPIKNLITNVMNLKIKSEKDEITSIKDFVSNIITKNDQNQEMITKSLPLLRENLLLNLLINHVVDETDVYQKVSYYGIGFKYPGYLVALVLLDKYSDFVKNHSLKDRINSKHYLLQLIQEHLNQKYIVYGVETEGDKLCFIINVNDDFNFEELTEAFVKIKQMAYGNILNTFTVAIGSIYKSLSEIGLSYLEATEASKERFTQGENSIIFIRDLELKTGAFYTHVKKEEELLEHIFNRNEEKIIEVIQYILEDANNKGLQSEKIKQIVLEIISFVGRRLFKVGLTYEEILKSNSSMLESLGKCVSVKEMQDYINRILLEVSKYVGKQETTGRYDVVGKVKEYIDKNYEKEITLKQLSDLVMLTPSYLSTIFYNKVQYNFVEYVNLVRVNKAKELLMDSKFSIKDVSDKVGFINYNTFSRVFKKYAGVSAKQYRYEQGIKAGDDIQE